MSIFHSIVEVADVSHLKVGGIFTINRIVNEDKLDPSTDEIWEVPTRFVIEKMQSMESGKWELTLLPEWFYIHSKQLQC